MTQFVLRTDMTMKRYSLIILVLTIIALSFGINSALAQPDPAPVQQTSALHPTFALLDASGRNVLETDGPVSTMQTCGQCHDTEFIQSHSFHSDLGLRDYKENRSFQASTGTFGKWDPLTYRFLSQTGDERLDLGTPEWLSLYGDRIVGGGPAATSRNGKLLTEIAGATDHPETAILNENGTTTAWHWESSGTLEMNCFLCHIENPDLEARKDIIRGGDFDMDRMATLNGTGIVIQSSQDGGLKYNLEAFDTNGRLQENLLNIQDPTSANCAACHGEIHTTDEPLTISAYDLTNPQTATTGQVVSAQWISDSGMNISGKEELNRSWDVHAERQLQCTDCHYSLNNPAHADEAQKAEPDHLLYDPRVLEISEYLQKPDHNFARGQSAQFNAAPDYKGTMRRCENCHDADEGHAGWLPYIETHMDTVACETCHIPQLYAPAIQSFDWTVLQLDHQPVKVYRGVDGNPDAVTSLVTGYQPVLLNRTNIDGQQLLAPYNLITTYYWVYEDANGNKRPVRLFDLEATYFKGNAYATDILSEFDTDKDGTLSSTELVIDSSAKAEAVSQKLKSLGLNNVHIEALTQPYSVNHNVTRGEYAVNDCATCHSDRSRVSQPIRLASYAPNGVLPAFDTANNVNASGEIVKSDDGAAYYYPIPANDDLYVFGSSRVNWIDWLGSLMFVGTIFGVAGHGTLRVFSSRKQPRGPARTERIYMYESYRRFWHWLQTITIVTLLFTGLIIHRPDIFGAFSFRGMVTVHNVLAVILVVNALLSVFYHVTTERVREYIPHPYGFFDDAIVQSKYYMAGIFKHEPHPFEKRPDSRMNPIQKATYFGILNVLLPLQILTGALMWGVQKFPGLTDWFGGLPFLAPFHSLIAWTFATFIIGHVYMTTTGATPIEATRAMITGYEEVEVHEVDREKEEVKGEKE